MKRIILLLTSILLVMTSCGKTVEPTIPTETPKEVFGTKYKVRKTQIKPITILDVNTIILLRALNILFLKR